MLTDGTNQVEKMSDIGKEFVDNMIDLCDIYTKKMENAVSVKEFNRIQSEYDKSVENLKIYMEKKKAKEMVSKFDPF
jgi:hypothetical protein